MSTGRRVSQVRDLLVTFKKMRGRLAAKKTGSAGHWANGLVEVASAKRLVNRVSRQLDAWRAANPSMGQSPINAALTEPTAPAVPFSELQRDYLGEFAAAPDLNRFVFPEKADCQVCGKTITVKADGTLRAHGPANDRCGGDWR